MYEVIAKGGHNGKFLYITYKGTVVPVERASVSDILFPELPVVKDFAGALKVLELLNLEAAAETNW